MSNVRRNLDSFIELSCEQQENISGGNSKPSSFTISLPQLPNLSNLGISFPGLFGGEVKKTTFSKEKKTENEFSESNENGDFSVNDSSNEAVDANSLTFE
ncbi:MAG: CTB family bacteriocin [Rivularia sp. (in: Bacteria)]|nr:CTB family bacteriocin [Rivularia sp. MS3]